MNPVVSPSEPMSGTASQPRIGGNPVGGQHEAREVLRTSGLGGGLALWYVFKNRSAVTESIVLLDPSGANSSRIKPAFGAGADCSTEPQPSADHIRSDQSSAPAVDRTRLDHIRPGPCGRPGGRAGVWVVL